MMRIFTSKFLIPAKSPDDWQGLLDKPLGPSVDEWLTKESKGKHRRLRFILEQLGLDASPRDVRYQLLPRTASANIEATRFAAQHAVLLIHSFSQQQAWFSDYVRLAALLGAHAHIDQPPGAVDSNSRCTTEVMG